MSTSDTRTTPLRQSNKEKRRQAILSRAIALFGSQGIEATTMEQIAEAAGIGSATIYRYFPTKNDVVVAAVIEAWQEQSQHYLPQIESPDFDKLCGQAQVRYILGIFIDLYDHAPDFLWLLMAFDSYTRGSGISREQLDDYQQVIIFLKGYAVAALEKGCADGTLYLSKPPELVYFTIFHTMLSLTSKLICQGDILEMDSWVDGREELLLLRELLLRGLSPVPAGEVKSPAAAAVKQV